MIRNRWFHYIIGGVLGLLLIFILNLGLYTTIKELSILNTPTYRFININLSFIPLLISTILVVIFYHKYKISNFINSNGKFNYKRVIFGFSLWFTFQFITLIYTLVFNKESLLFNFEAKSFYNFLLLSLLLTPIQVAAEEIIFRGYLIKFLQSINKRFYFSLIISGVLFSLPHLSNPEVTNNKLLFFLIYFSMSIILAYVTLKYNGLEYSFGIHLANNLYAINLLNYPNSPLPSSPVFMLKNQVQPLQSLIETVIFGALLIIIIKKVENNNYQIEKK